MNRLIGVLLFASIAGAVGRTAPPSAPSALALAELFKPGVLFQDRNGDGAIDYVNARVALPDKPSPVELAAAADIAARLGFETSAMNLPVVRAKGDGTTIPTIFVGAKALADSGTTAGAIGGAALKAGDGLVTAFTSGGQPAVAVLGGDDNGLTAAAVMFAGHLPYVWDAKGPTTEKVGDEVKEFLSGKGITASSAAATLPPEEATKSLMVAALEQSIWTALLDPAATDRFRGIADVRQQGDLARVGVRIRLADGDSAALVHLRMTRADAHWRVVGVEGLAPYMRSAVEGRYQRAYEAELRSDLRNLVTAQAVYFTDHAAYARSLAALVYDATPGVRVEILEASHDGWSAVARHRESSVECRVAIGTALPAGAVAGAVTCSGGG